MGRRTVAVPNIKRCRRITGFPLTGNASASSVFMLCGLSANATIPASRPLGRNVSGSAAAAALLTSTPWHISLLWLLLWPPFFPALTPTAHPNSSGAPPDPPHSYPISGAVHSRAWISAPFGPSKALPVPSSYSNGIFIRLFCSSLSFNYSLTGISRFAMQILNSIRAFYHKKLSFARISLIYLKHHDKYKEEEYFI